METVTKEELEKALLDLTDGQKTHDLVGMTGLSDERCEEIRKLVELVRKNHEKIETKIIKKMKISELTEEQLVILADKNPEWVVDNRPVWMCKNRPVWIAINHPDLMTKCRPDWMIENHPEWMCKNRPDLMAIIRPDLMIKCRPVWMIKYRPVWMKQNHPELFEKYTTSDDVPVEIEELLK